MGPHRLICGSALDGEIVALLMAGETAQMVFTDPPYNVPIQGHVGGSGRIRHREFAMACGEMTTEAFTAFLRNALDHLIAHSRDGAIHFICMDWRHQAELLAAGKAYTELKNLIVWVKDNAGMGTTRGWARSSSRRLIARSRSTTAHVRSLSQWRRRSARYGGCGRIPAPRSR